MASRASTWSRWFWRTSRIAPALLVEGAAALDAEVLGHGDLHLADVAGVPDRLQQGVGEAQVEDVLDRPGSRKLSMRKMRSSGRWRCRTWLSSRAEARSRPNGFSTITRASSMQLGRGQPLGHGGEHARRDGEVVQRPLGVAQGLAQPLEGLVSA